MKAIRNYTLLVAAVPLVAAMNIAAGEKTIPVTAENFSHAETARKVAVSSR